MTRPLLVGLFVGGRATRMGGAAKGLLAAPDTGEPLAARLARICREAIPAAELVLVGDAGGYEALGLESLPDDPPGQGPLGGLRALLARGSRTESDVIALACDLPYVTPELVLRVATQAEGAPAVAPRGRNGGPWQPLFARYSPHACAPLVDALLASERRSLWGVLDGLGEAARVLPLTADEERLLADWDAPEDIARAHGSS